MIRGQLDRREASDRGMELTCMNVSGSDEHKSIRALSLSDSEDQHVRGRTPGNQGQTQRAKTLHSYQRSFLTATDVIYRTSQKFEHPSVVCLYFDYL